jgi:3-methyl-2-oxobutanoate hydroxymethyltransferase
MAGRLTVTSIGKMKAQGSKVVMATCYDYPSALLLDAAGIDMLLVGDSLGQAVLGYETTVPVTMDMMVHHARAVRRGSAHAMVVADMPFMSYQASAEDALRNAGRLMQEAEVEAVKVEGGLQMAPTVARLVTAGVPVVGHIGLTPQSVHSLGGYRTQGKEGSQAARLLADARALADAGAFAIVLELISRPVAAQITQESSVPTIGIGSGPECDGQVQVLHDLLGLYPDRRYRHAKRYCEVGQAIADAVRSYADEVRSGDFPGAEHSN